MTPQKLQSAFPEVMGWIHQTLATYDKAAQPVASRKFARLPQYFGQTQLEATKVVAVDRVPVPPLSSIGLTQFKEFERGDYDGITNLDTIFLKRVHASVEELYFHELIHVVQWRLLGPERFLALYADGLERFGYRNSPLEIMAYDAQDSFIRSGQVFDAERLVAQRLSAC
jgi:hypothetical protein